MLNPQQITHLKMLKLYTEQQLLCLTAVLGMHQRKEMNHRDEDYKRKILAEEHTPDD